jgi:oligopeptidase A
MNQAVLPTFSDIDIPQLPETLTHLLNHNRDQVKRLLGQSGSFSWENLMVPLEELDDRLEKFWSPVSHLNAVMNSDELRASYQACIPLLTAYHSDMGQDAGLYRAVQSLADSPQYVELSPARQKAVNHMLRDFRLSGVALDDVSRKRFADIEQRLSELSTQFSNNILDATDGWEKYLETADDLEGVPDSALALFRQQAQTQGREGYRLSLNLPSYLPVMQYCENRDLRRQLYEAYSTRASEQGPQAGRWDNSELMVEILQLRQEMAALLGFDSYAELSLETKMAESPEDVLHFLRDLVAASRPQAEKELAELREFARGLGCEELQAWDVPFYSEKLRLSAYAISQQQLKPYFPAPRVVEGLFAITGKLFGLRFEAVEEVDLWHQDAQCFRVYKDDKPVASFYFDLYARAKKRGGAWMADYCGSRRYGDGRQQPVAFLTCNFTPPTAGKPSLLTHDEVTTLFHEFGHGLHHMLTEVDVLKVAGINGVAWDAVELPSQFLENWCWQREAIPLISGHHETGEPLPDALLDKMLAARNFQSAMQMVRQLEFAIFDFRLHMPPVAASVDGIQKLLNEVRRQVAVIQPPAFNRFQHSFGHIFAGGYAAGYYSYKWAEVLSSDAFSLFEEEGVMNDTTGRRFREAILERGGSEEALELFVTFRGRQPSQDALLRHSGIQR